MKVKFYLSPILLAVALSPALMQFGTCSPKSGNADLLSLEIEAGGLDRLVGFDNDTLSYSVWLDGAATFIVRATAEDSNTAIGVWMGSTYVLMGNGSGETTIDTPADGTTIVVQTKSSGNLYKSFQIIVNSPCTGSECDDNNSCTSDACNANVCEFTAEPDGTPCTDADGGQDQCLAGICPANAVTKTIQMTCRIPITTVTEYWTLTIDPSGPIVAGQPFDVTISGAIETEDADDIMATFGNGLFPRAFRFGSIPVQVRSGATGSAALDIWNASGPYVCASDGSPCDPANDTAGMFSPNADCPASGDWCLPFTDQTIIDSSEDNCDSCAEPMNLGWAHTSQKNLLCIRTLDGVTNFTCNDSDPTPLVPVTATLVADLGATEVLFGFEEPWDVADFPSFNDGFGFDAAIGFVDPPSVVPPGPGGTFAQAYTCYMGDWVSGPGGGGAVVDPLPDSALVSIPITSTASCLTDADCDDGIDCTIDLCCPQVGCETFEGCVNVQYDPANPLHVAYGAPSCGQNGVCVGSGNCECTAAGWNACDDGTICTIDSCDPYTASCGYSPAPPGTDCSFEFPPIAECDGNGSCVFLGCLSDADCPPEFPTCNIPLAICE